MKPYFTKSMRCAGLIIAVVWSMSFAVTDADWSTLGTGLNDYVRALALDSSGNLYAGGDFSTAGGISANHIIKWNGTAWVSIGNISSDIYSLTADRYGNIYAVGMSPDTVVKWNGTSWHALGTGSNGTIFCIAADSNGNIYVGGRFTTINGVSATNIAKWDGTAWSALGTGTNDTVFAITFDKTGNLYAGGFFTTAGGTTANRIAKWNGTTWSTLSSGVNYTVYSLAIDENNHLYAGGSFTTAGSIAAQYIAMWNNTTWVSLGSGTGSRVNALTVDKNNNIYASGYFSSLANTTAKNILQWNGTNGTALGSGLNYSALTSVYDRFTGKLYVGGYFTTAGTTTCNCIASCQITNPDNTPTVPILSSPTNGTNGLASSIILNWSSVPQTTVYHVQVSTSSSFATLFTQDSSLTVTSKYISGLTEGVTYYWRVRACNSSGTGLWSVVWHFTTAGAVPVAAPVQTSPANDTTGLDTATILSWDTLSDATKYHVQIATDSAFSTPIIQDSLLTTGSKSISGLAYYTKYYWRVRGLNVLGYGPFSGIRTFTTIVKKPVLVLPANNAANQSVPIALVWQKVNGAAKYRVQISTTSAFTVTIKDSLLNDTTGTFGALLPVTKYYWRVNAKTADDHTGLWSSVYSFTTVLVVPATPTLVSPTNGAAGQTTAPVMTWNTVSNATSYAIQVATSSTFTSLVIQDSNLTVSTKTLSGLSVNTTYYWRVRAKNSAGASTWSTAWNFTTVVSQLVAPTLTSPAQSANGLGITVTFSWSSISGASKYYLQIATSSTFTSIFIQDSTLTTASTNISGFSLSAIYYWRVKGISSTGESGLWSSVFNFSPGSTSIKRDGAFKTPTALFITSAGSSLRYGLPAACNVTIKLYTLKGQLAATLHSGFQSAGVYFMALPTQSLAKARYIVELKAGNRTITGRL